MKYLVTAQTSLFNSSNYEIISVKQSLELLKPMRIIGLDTETKGFDVYKDALLSIQLGTFDIQIFVDLTTINFQLYKAFLEEKHRLFLLTNAKFDLKFLYHHRIILNQVYDVYLAEKLLYLGYPSGQHGMSLQFMANKYLGIKLDKSIRGKIIYQNLNEEIIIYGCNDVKYLEKIKEAQSILLAEKELHKALEIENQFVKTLAYIEYCGIRLCPDRWKAKMQKDQIALDKAELELNNWVIKQSESDKFFKKYVFIERQGDLFTGFDATPKCNINWNSSKQLIPIFLHLGFNLWTKDKKTGKQKQSIEAKIIDMQKSISSISKPYLNYTSQAKLVSTYGQTFLNQINPVSGRIHTQFNQLMDTGRLSCGGKNKNTKEEYVNIQNLPSDPETRGAFIPNKGYVLIDCDYSAQEDFIFTELSQEPKLIEFYNDTKRKRDGHSFVAKICFPEELNEIAEEEVKHKRSDLRALAKKAKFAIHYGGNGSTIARNLSLPDEQGYAIEKAYLNGFSNINSYFKHVKKDMWDKGYILINQLTGHKMFIPTWEELKEVEASFTSEFWDKYRAVKQKWIEEGSDPMDKPYLMQKVSKFFKSKSGYERNSLNAPVQGSAALTTKIAGIKLFNYLKENNLLFIVLIPNCVHDEYLVESPVEISEKIAKVLQQCMESSGDIFCKSVKLKAVPEIADHWTH